ncbi:SIS domain-containing protein [Streptomyces silaceus]|uniref:SIS domain-containing protein n=1 Tax=Streptomyces silaceus TaxID=545123 RepID=UPI0006EB3C25|nr:SIS domain-containing protein [Streptomyces silaceus]
MTTRPPYSTEEMRRQVRALAPEFRQVVDHLARTTADGLLDAPLRGIRRVVLTGNGDSYHAARAAELAFERIGGVACEPLSAQRFLDHGLDGPGGSGPDTLVVGISASGTSGPVVRVLEEAARRGTPTVAVTASEGSPVTRVADVGLIAPTGPRQASPGILTYQASLAALFVTAIRLGSRQGAQEGLLDELRAVGDAVRATVDGSAAACDELARELADGSGPLVVTGTGPQAGTAKFAAAKVVEACGLPAFAQDLEEWWHVERFALPRDSPLVVLAPPGASHARAVDLVARATGIGRRVVAVARHGDPAVAGAHRVLPTHGEIREEWSPLVDHVFAGLLGAGLGDALGRVPFSTR